VIFAYTSAKKSEDVNSWHDAGLPPPAIKPINLSAHERQQVESCDKRRYLFSFQGRKRKGDGRDKLLKFNEYDDMFVRILDQKTYIKEVRKDMESDSQDYKEIMKKSTFAAAPRGDQLFSYRFAEILSAGTVPVVYAGKGDENFVCFVASLLSLNCDAAPSSSDGWLTPFNNRVVNWKACAVFIPESKYERTRDILTATPESQRCKMQKCALRVWDMYVSSRAGWVRGLVNVALSRY
jgi:hypothetical protein